MEEKEIWVEDEGVAREFKLNFKTPEEAVIEIAKFADLEKVKELERKGKERAFILCKNWKVIPLENLIALCKKIKIIAIVENAEEAKVALETLEKGTSGVLLKRANEEEIKKLKQFLLKPEKLSLEEATIVGIKKVGLGARSCIDTSELMSIDEGMLVGSSASAFVLMQAEVSENPHVASRPFRVNAGALSLYILADEEKTKYLSEVKAGDTVTIVNRKGETRKATVVRNKIEWRPLLLIEAECGGRKIKTLAQDAETIRILTPEDSKSVAELKPGDKILVHLEEEKARHFGMKVEEKIIEK